jgi:hypothetical protein
MFGEGECVRVTGGRLKGCEGVVLESDSRDGYEWAKLVVYLPVWYDVHDLASAGGREGVLQRAGAASFCDDGA